jgi:hypothetical protein
MEKIIEKTEIRKIYWITCSICGRGIRGDSPKAAQVNLKTHLQWHKSHKGQSK